MMGSAQLDILPVDEVGDAAPPSALKQQVAERLAAHRERRARGGAADVAELSARPASPKNRIAARVAERYAQTPSYRAFLAEEAERAIERASAAAEVAARNAEAVAAVQQELLAELELWVAPQEFTPESVAAAVVASLPVVERPKVTPPPVRQVSSAGLTVRLYEDVGRTPVVVTGESGGQRLGVLGDADEARALDEEIAFRQAPVFEDYTLEPATPLPANLLEFPRQLVASKKARPRLAEGPLREDGPKSPQLRIFEVEPEQISHAPAPVSSAPEWSNIRLSAHTVTEPLEYGDATLPEILPSLLPPLSAPIAQRLMATSVDGVLVLGGFVGFVAMFARVAGPIEVGVPLALGAAGTLAALWLAYQVLFFTLSDQTPGMRYARIGLCTFTDENPSRSAMRRRILAQIVAVCPMGLGLLWALLDDDRLGWHDRISRMYQRAY